METFEKEAIDAVLSAVKALVKNPTQATELKDILLEVRDAINNLYPDSVATPATSDPTK